MTNDEPVGPETYQQWRATVLGAITERLEKKLVSRLLGPVRDRLLLDVGTGDGTYALEMAERNADVVGVDIQPDMLDAARARAGDRNLAVDFRRADVLDLPFDDGTFDRIVAVTVLCFVSETSRTVEEMARVLAPGGRIVIGELGRWSLWAARRRMRGWLGSETWSSAHFWSRGELAELLASARLEVEDVEGAIHYPPVDWMAQLFEPIDPLLGRLGAPGAAFLAASARRPE